MDNLDPGWVLSRRLHLFGVHLAVCGAGVLVA
jgi:hypothetical protein